MQTHLFELLNLIPQGVHHIHQTPWKWMFLSVTIQIELKTQKLIKSFNNKYSKY